MSTKIPIIRKDGQEKTPSVTVVLLAKDILKKLAKLNDSIELYSELDDEKTIKACTRAFMFIFKGKEGTFVERVEAAFEKFKDKTPLIFENLFAN